MKERVYIVKCPYCFMQAQFFDKSLRDSVYGSKCRKCGAKLKKTSRLIDSKEQIK